MALQQTTPEGTSIRTEGTIPPAAAFWHQDQVDATPDLRTALWLTVPDIHPAMRAQAEVETDGALEGLLRSPRSRINPAGPVFVRPPVDADDDLAVAMQVRGLRLFGRLTAIQLDRIGERFRLDESEMTAALAHETVLPEPRARTSPGPSATTGCRNSTPRRAWHCPSSNRSSASFYAPRSLSSPWREDRALVASTLWAHSSRACRRPGTRRTGARR
ncbi:hypothetical protein [Streptomyces aureus]|uniref:hypothetical protein n=1 Tax=Streptomyces aureus TaxID=193461 RepID=UPI0006E13B77|nr:hypothetical protein [Streptomyces aureus]